MKKSKDITGKNAAQRIVNYTCYGTLVGFVLGALHYVFSSCSNGIIEFIEIVGGGFILGFMIAIISLPTSFKDDKEKKTTTKKAPTKKTVAKKSTTKKSK